MFKILCTGFGGVVGNALFPILLKNNLVKEITNIGKGPGIEWGEKHIHFSYDLTEKKYVDYFINSNDFDTVFHFAAISTSNSDPTLVWENTNMTLNLLDSLSKKGKSVRFIQASSIIAEYATSVYSTSKYACEQLCESYSRMYPHITTCSVRFPAVVGLGATHGLLPDLIAKLSSNSEVVELFGKRPGAVKPFIYNKVLAYILNDIGFSNKFDFYNPIMICPPNAINVEDVAIIVMNEMQIFKEIIWNPTKVWVGDVKQILPNGRFITENYPQYKQNSEEAIKLATRDILESLTK